jgi:hypothetical protein
MLSVIMLSVMAPHAPMQCFQNELAYFDTIVSYARKMFIKLPPVRCPELLALWIEGKHFTGGWMYEPSQPEKN